VPIEPTPTLIEDLEEEAKLREAVAWWIDGGGSILGEPEDAAIHRAKAAELRKHRDRLREEMERLVAFRDNPEVSPEVAMTAAYCLTALWKANGGPLGGSSSKGESGG
jgi:hypothetical protein